MINCALVLLPIVFLLLGILTQFACSSKPVLRETMHSTAKHPHSPENSVIVFDLHGVLFKPDYKQIMLLFLKSPYTLTLIKHMFNPYLLRDFYRLWHKNVIAEEYFNHVTTQYPQLAACKSLFSAVANAQKPIVQTVDLVQQLKQQGYKLHVLSNIGEHLFAQLHHKFSALFSCFDQIKVTTAAEQYIGKPNLPIFYAYLRQCNPEQKQVIFIDNRLKNIKAAQEVGFIGLHFTHPKTLKKQLQQLMIVA